MAESIIDIVLRIKDDAGKVITKVVSDIGELNRAAGKTPSSAGLDSLGAAAKSVGTKAKEGAEGINSLEGAARNLVGGVGTLKTSLNGLIPALVGAVGLMKLKELADVGAKVQVTGTVLRVVANNAGISGTEINKLDKEIQGLGITAVDSGKSLTQFIQAGLGGLRNESLGKAKELARAAQDLAVVSGENSSETFSRLITNIQQMDTMGLRFMGITVSMEKAQDKFATSIGKTAAELTEAEKKQAFMNATLVEAAKLTGTYEAAMNDAAKQLSSLPRLQDELKTQVAEVLQPAYSALIVTFSDFLKEAKKMAQAWKEAGDGGVGFGETVGVVATVLKNVTLFLAEHADIILTVAAAWAGAKVIGLLIPIIAGVVTSFVSLIDVMIAFKALNMGMWFLEAKIAFGAWALAIRSGNIAEMLLAIRTALLALRVGLLAVMPYLAPLVIAITALWLAWDWVSSKISSKKLDVDTEEAKKKLTEMMGTLQEAKLKAAEAQRVANVGSDDPGEQKYLDKLAKEAKAEAALEQAKVDKYAKENKLGKEALELADRQAEGNRKIQVSVKEMEAEYEKLKNARKNLGVTDDTGLDSVKRAKKSLGELDALFEKAMADLHVKEETHQQRLARVLDAGVETAKTIADKAAAAGMGVEEWLDKFHPKAEAMSSWSTLAAAIEAGGESARQAFSDASVGFANLLEKAKTPAEIYTVLEGLGNYAELFANRVKAAKETLTFRAEAAEVASLNAAIVGFTENLKKLRTASELVASLHNDAAQADRVWRDTITQLGGAFNDLGQYVASSQGGLRLFKDVTVEMSASQAAAGDTAFTAAQQRYVNEEALARASYEKKKALIAQTAANEKQANTMLAGLDRELITARTENAKQLYASLKQLQAEALNNFKDYASKVKDLDKAIAASREQKASDIREINRKGMSEEEQAADKMAEYQELLAKAQQAVQQKAYDKAQEYATKAKELAKGLGDSIDLTQQSEMVGDAWDVIIAAQEKSKEEANKAAAEQLAAYEKMSESLATLSEQLEKMAGEQTAKVMLEVDKDSLQAAIKMVEEEFSKLTVKVNVSADTSGAQGFAVGGLIDGPGSETSDSILAAVSRNEFINTARSVRHYGADLFYALNNMSIPRNLLRSILGGGAIPRFAGGGMPGGVVFMPTISPDTVELNLTYNRQALGTVRGSRGTINGLVDALNDISRGT